VIRRLSLRWLVGGCFALVAAVVGVALAVQTGAAPACAAPPTGSTVHKGKATFYDSQGGGGNCSNVGPPSNRLYVALSPSEYAGAAACGGYLDVTGPKGKVRVLIMDQCPECPTGHIDLSKEAFAKIADPVQGVVPVTYRAVINPSLPGPLTFRIKEGASRYWFAVLVGNHGNPLRSVEVKSGSSWRKTVRKDYNYWLYESGLGPGPYTIRVTDVYGQQATVTGVKMAPEQTQRTTVFMYGKGSAPKAAPASPSPRKASPTKPTPSATRSSAPTPSPTAPTPTRDQPAGAVLAAADQSC
jgi:expansin (peptidoglycan-binding protein)